MELVVESKTLSLTKLEGLHSLQELNDDKKLKEIDLKDQLKVNKFHISKFLILYFMFF